LEEETKESELELSTKELTKPNGSTPPSDNYYMTVTVTVIGEIFNSMP
jgi:hypothetical protein